MKAFLVAVALCGACSGDLPPASRVDKLRVLAVRAEPPEVMPGQPSQLDTLTALPPAGGDGGAAPSVTYLWLACLEAAGASGPVACGVSESGNGGADAFASGAMNLPGCLASPSAPLCLIGAGPKVSYTPSDAALGGQVILTVVVADAEAGNAIGCAMDAAGNGGAPLNPDHCVIALKRLTVSNATRPNHNPTLDGFTLDGTPAGASVPDRLPAPSSATQVAVAATRAAGSAEVKSDGTVEPLYVSWFISAGRLSETRTSFQPADCDPACTMRDPPRDVATRFTAPSVDDARRFVHGGEIDFWAVVRDDRGGVGWAVGRGVE